MPRFIKSTQNAQGLRAPCLRRLATIIGMLVVTMVIPVVGHSAPPVPFAELPAWTQQGCRNLSDINDAVENIQAIMAEEIEPPVITTTYRDELLSWRQRWSTQNANAYTSAVNAIDRLVNATLPGAWREAFLKLPDASICTRFVPGGAYMSVVSYMVLGFGTTAAITAAIVDIELDNGTLTDQGNDGQKDELTISLEDLRQILVSRLDSNLIGNGCSGVTTCVRLAELRSNLGTYLANLTSCFGGVRRVDKGDAQSLRKELQITKISGTSSYKLGGNQFAVTNSNFKDQVASAYMSKVTVGFYRLLAGQAKGAIPSMGCPK
jgi:hypothetical protein